MTTKLMELAEAWHAPDCEVDAGGGCILHSDEKEAWITVRERDELLAEVDRLRAVMRDVAVALHMGNEIGACNLLAKEIDDERFW